MADIYGGRVLAGEDSEEDGEDEEEMSFQFNGFGSQSSPAASRFATPTIAVASAGEDNEEDEENDEEEENEILKLKLEEKTKDLLKEVTHEEDKTRETEQAAKRDFDSLGTKQKLWHVDESVNGVEVMSAALVETVQPSLDATIRRIAELKESQQRLLMMLTEQNIGLKSNKQLEDAAIVLEKLPFYAKKLQGIKLAMQEISNSTEKMKHRSESLRIDAQSYAIKKENKRDAQSQWNKLYAAKSTSAQS
ncbi:hypothetical protein KXD40_005332 [Peronospora effusa]|uniref:Snapin/Pallidin/Snn1 n=1 Tax=Peronospora effusa TaxID=542832 RepID=A0A3M6VGJ6_9STRA|nr:hypothetical protein DD238_005815 [Peronospora effusa]RQM16772.1 hypothetical protein DD237_000579 [Peronospora effusa]UIZ22285.1 hypothetical protein KXD40_005332 [Peronospora effusa]CAI5700649.1 unnamed protein product [Peronospora effusa]